MNRNFLVVLLFFITGCSASRIHSVDDHKIKISFIQLNDVYEIAPLEGGTAGGFARVATIKKEAKSANINTFMIMAGDFLSPSVYNSLKHEGKRIRGKQMVETMNAAGVDFAVFGNHEFDITEEELQSRLNESDFKWISSNSFHKKDGQIKAFEQIRGNDSYIIPETYILTLTDSDGTKARVGFMGITLPFNKASFVSYTDPLLTAEKMYNKLKDSADVIIAITHQSMADDILLAERLPDLAMIIGGHEHDRRFQKIGKVIISKAHANAKSIYKLDLTLNILTKKQKVKSSLKYIDNKIADDAETDSVVKKWTRIADNNYAALGFKPERIVINRGSELEGREAQIRSAPTNLSLLIVKAMESAAPLADISIVNSGSIRVDDVLKMPVTEYDLLRTLPFGGSIVEVEMKGLLLKTILDIGNKNRGTGGYLVHSQSGNEYSESLNLVLKGKLIDNDSIYRVALTDFLLTGGEANLGFLNANNPSITKIYPVSKNLEDPRTDIRLAIVHYLLNLK